MKATTRAVAAVRGRAVLVATPSLASAAVPRADALGGSGQQSIVAVTQYGAGYLTVGSDQPHGQPFAKPVVWTARSDGTHWARSRPLASSPGTVPHLEGIVSAPNGIKVAVGSVDDDTAPDKPPCCGGVPGFFVSTDAGGTFDRATDVQTVQAPDGSNYGLVEVNAITVGPDGTFVAVGDASGAPDTSGAFRRPLVWTSGDGGRSWQVADLPMDTGAGGLAVAITVDSQGLLAAGTEYPDQNGSADEPVVWRSTNGATWTPTTVPVNGSATGVASSDVGIVVVGTTDKQAGGVFQNCGGTMWFSDDAGNSWSNTARDPNSC